MKTGFLNLDQILDIKRWQCLQDSLANITKLAIITVDYKGIPVTRHSGLRPFCGRVRANADLVKYCNKCDSRAGLEAVRANAPYIYLCHCGIVDIAIPIIVDGHYIGALMAGQALLPEGESKTDLEQIIVSPSRTLFADGEFKAMLTSIPTMSYEEIKSVADMLFDLCAYVVEEAINKNLLKEMYEQLCRTRTTENAINPFSGYPASSIEFAKQTMNDAITKSYVTSDGEKASCKNHILAPAMDYIYKNKGENISQKQMAELCHISVSHFSRLFTKEKGEGFSSFLARQKVEWSKQLLESTELTTAQISDTLGFSSPGYYIKTFKRYENTTPMVYRKYSREGILS